LRVAVNAEQLLYRSPGGIGRYTAQLLTLLPRLEPGIEVRPVVARHPRTQVEAVLRAAGVTGPAAAAAVQALPRPLLYEAWNRLARPALRGVPGVDLVHAPSVAVPPAGGRPLVVTVHDAATEVYPEAFPPRGRRFHRAGLAAAARRADAVITGSQSAADEIAGHSPIPPERIRVVPYCVDPPVDPGPPPAGLEGPYVLWVGSLEPRKGVGTLVGAMARLARAGRHRGVLTVLAGYQGWLSGDLVDPEDVAALGPALRARGRVGESELWSLYRHASVFAFPSRHEGFGLPVIEAMSQGCPVVAADIAPVREAAGAAALLVPPDRPDEWAEAIASVLDGGSVRHRLAAAGPARAASFTPAAMAAGTAAVYRELGS
jgi:glycosyltransferase involved in cell wall biosynthesis